MPMPKIKDKSKNVNVRYSIYRENVNGMLEDENYFRQVSTDGFTVVWPEGQDICPDELYNL